MQDDFINSSAERIFSKIEEINPQNLNISDQSKEYLMKYIDNQSFFLSAYSQLLQKAILKLDRPVNESTFIDYGGGCGILSYIAKEMGFKTIVYSDINKNSVNDTKIISGKLNIVIDYYFCGDVDELINKIKLYGINTDLICSFDVLEHIYDLEYWIKSISVLNRFSLLFMTNANPENPLIVRRLIKVHKIAEHQGGEKNIRIDDNFLSTSLLKQREIIIRNKFPHLSKHEIILLSKETRGLIINDIEKIVFEYIKTGKINYKMVHPTNTCDPYTGSWAEKLIDLNQIKALIKELKMSVRITNSFYCYSGNNTLNVLKYLLNLVIKLSGPTNLFLSPAITLEIEKQIP